jgi:proline racemase
MVEKLKWLRRHGDALRRLLMLEPRGHAGMHGAMLTEPTSPLALAGVLSMHAAGFPLVSGEAVIGAVTIALEHKLIEGVEGEVLIDTPAGLFRASPHTRDGRIASVELTGVPSFVHSAGLVLKIGTRHITVDIAFGGHFYAIADSEAIGIPIDIANASALVRMGREITDAIESKVHVQHPTDAGVKDVHGTIFTGAARGASDLRSATVLGGEVLRRSPGATGTAALMAVLDAMGLLTDDRRFTHEGVLGTTLQGGVVRRLQLGETAAIVPVVEASASITGFHEFVNA